MEVLADQGFEGMAVAMQTLLSQAMKIERNEFLRAAPAGRTRSALGGLAAFALPEPHRRHMRETNKVERLNAELHRRKRDATLFRNEASLLRLVSTTAAEISEDWETGRAYLNPESE